MADSGFEHEIQGSWTVLKPGECNVNKYRVEDLVAAVFGSTDHISKAQQRTMLIGCGGRIPEEVVDAWLASTYTHPIAIRNSEEKV